MEDLNEREGISGGLLVCNRRRRHMRSLRSTQSPQEQRVSSGRRGRGKAAAPGNRLWDLSLSSRESLYPLHFHRFNNYHGSPTGQHASSSSLFCPAAAVLPSRTTFCQIS